MPVLSAHAKLQASQRVVGRHKPSTGTFRYSIYCDCRSRVLSQPIQLYFLYFKKLPMYN